MTANLHLFELITKKVYLNKAKIRNSLKLLSVTVLPFNTLMLLGNKRSYILKINSSFSLQICLSTFDIFLSLGIEGLKWVQSVLLLMKKIITVVVKDLSFVLEIPFSEFHDSFSISCFLWHVCRNWERYKGGTKSHFPNFIIIFQQIAFCVCLS